MNTEKARENTMRRFFARRGITVRKSRSDGSYSLVDANYNALICWGMDLDQVVAEASDIRREEAIDA